MIAGRGRLEREREARRQRASRGLWAGNPKGRKVARRQAQKLADALAGNGRSFPGFPPLSGVWYPRGYRYAGPIDGCDPGIPYSPHTRSGREPMEVLDRHEAWAVGYHAGRVMALRLAAYDARERNARVAVQSLPRVSPE